MLAIAIKHCCRSSIYQINIVILPRGIGKQPIRYDGRNIINVLDDVLVIATFKR